MNKKILKEGEPCIHMGCLNHVSHPCEGCGRIAGKEFDGIMKNSNEEILNKDNNKSIELNERNLK